MSFQVRGPGWPVVALTTAAVVFVVGFSVSTQGPGNGRRITRVNGYEAVEGEVLVKYREGFASANHAAIESSADAESVEALDRRGARKLRSKRLRTAELLALLADDPAIEYAEPNYVMRLDATPNDSSFPSLWGLFNTGVNTVGGGGIAGADIDAPSAWNISTGSRTNVVAIFDTGVDYTHPDLAANMWSAPSAFQVTVGGVTVTCQAGTHGFNAITRTCDPMDDQYHGTHVAGTIGARGNNGVGVVGVNWVASMMAIKFMGSSGTGLVSDAVIGMEFVTQAKAAFASTRGANVRVLSNSWGGGGSTALLNAINAANSNDMLYVASAGNHGTDNDVAPRYPSSYSTPNMVSVASSTNTDQLSSFSNYGYNSVHIAAPGSSIVSTAPGNSFLVASGTSMAAPHVSGAALLTLSMCEASTAELRDMLFTVTDQVTALAGKISTGGRLNARSLMNHCDQPKVTNVTLTSSVASPRALGTTVTWTAVPRGGDTPWSYRWLVWDGTTWTTAQNWSGGNSFIWTPGTASPSYRVMVQVRSGWNTGTPEFSVSQPFEILSPVTSATLTPNLVSPQGIGATVTWTASAAGGEAPYKYQFAVWNGSAWVTERTWDTSDTFTWTPSVVYTDYKVAVQVRSAASAGNSEFNLSKPFAIRPVATGVTLNANVASPRLLGATVTWTAAASGGEGPYQYRFSVWNGVAWTVTRAWDSSASYAWTPTVANADYKVLAQARSAWNTGAAEFGATRSFAVMPPVSALGLVPDLASPRAVGTTVSFATTASGGQSPYQFQWSVRNGGAWVVAQAWSTSNAFVWTPTVASSGYQVKVEARGSWNAGAAEREATLSYTILPVVTGATVTPNLSSPRASGTTVRWTASASGGQAPYQYRWAVWNGSVWTTVSTWSTSPTFDWTPSLPNANYKIAVVVRSAWNTGAAEFTAVQPFVIQ